MQINKSNMIHKIISLLVFTSFAAAVTIIAAPTPTLAPSSQRPSSKKIKKETTTAPTSKNKPSKTVVTSKVSTTAPLRDGWSLVNGAWLHSDGYKYMNGQVIRTGSQTHKRPPKPPMPADLDAAKKKKEPRTPAEIAAEKAAERERNLTPHPAPQTGTHL